MSVERKFHLQRDPVDIRDYKFSKLTAKLAAPTPRTVDLRARLNPVYDQGSLGSCTSQAICGHIYHNRKIETSRLFVYFNERVLEGTVNQDAGATLRSGIRSLTLWGAPKEPIWPYHIPAWKTRPSLSAYVKGRQFLLRSYHRIITLDDMTRCLAEGYPFIAGMAVFSSFMSSTVAQTGVATLPVMGDSFVGGHAVLVVGYDLDRRTFLCRNSWSEQWGMGGYFTLPFLYFTNFGLVWDMWTLRS